MKQETLWTRWPFKHPHEQRDSSTHIHSDTLHSASRIVELYRSMAPSLDILYNREMTLALLDERMCEVVVEFYERFGERLGGKR